MMMHSRKIRKITRGSGLHWVGNGFPVNTLFSYTQEDGISPFLLLDYAGPTEFSPTSTSRGVGFHPHRGFETVTIVYEGEVEHRDTAGNAGKIGPGDVQWMTAAAGLLHEEKHSADFTRHGGKLEIVQLWVNLPAKDKQTAPRYQSLLNSEIPVVTLDKNAGHIRVIAGEFHSQSGAAQTFTPVHLYDIRLNAGAEVRIPTNEGFNTAFLVLSGALTVSQQMVKASELALLDTSGDSVVLQASTETSLLLMSGEPIDEPIAGYGPFVMNTESEIQQAIQDFSVGLEYRTPV